MFTYFWVCRSFSSSWRWTGYDWNPYKLKNLLQAVEEACGDTVMDSIQDCLRHSSAPFPHCLARANITCDVLDELRCAVIDIILYFQVHIKCSVSFWKWFVSSVRSLHGRDPQIWPPPAEFSSNPDQTHLSMLIRVFKIVRRSQVSEFDQRWSRLNLQGKIWGTLLYSIALKFYNSTVFYVIVPAPFHWYTHNGL